jgi:hypothetical protein
MSALNRPIRMYIKPIQTEGNNKRPNGPQQSRGKSNSSWRANDNLVQKFTQHNNIKRRKSINFMWDINSGGVPSSNKPFRNRRVAEYPHAFLNTDRYGCDGDLASDPQTLNVKRDIQTQRTAGHAEP